MTDKEKLHQILSSLWENDDSVGKTYYNQALQDVQTAIDLQEEPVSDDLDTELDKYIKDNFTIDKEQLDRFGIEEKDYMYSMDKSDLLALVEHVTNWQKTKEESVSEDLEEACEQLAENTRKHKAETSSPFFGPTDYKQGVMDGAKWQKAKDESTTEDLSEYINELSKQFPEVSFAKLSRIAVRVTKWHRDQIKEALLSEVLPCFMHGGEADEVVAKLEEMLNKK